MNLIVAFITGLTTGGLSCLAVQGGLLASSLASQIETDLKTKKAGKSLGNSHGNSPGLSHSTIQGASRSKSLSKHLSKPRHQKFQPRIAQPIGLFLVAKLVAYTLLGGLLGALGSVLQLTPLMRAVLMIVIGIFMLGNGLRMLNVHPIFRYFIIEPPSALTRYIRRTSKNGTSLLTPLFLGAMTVLIPCGITQAVMAAAIGTGSPAQGAALMFAFTLGTTPVFFSVAYFATRLGASVEKYFTRIIALTVIILGLVSVDTGLNLAGSPISIGKMAARLMPQAQIANPASVYNLGQSSSLASSEAGYFINVEDYGYYPGELHLPANRPVSLNWITSGTRSCSRYVVIPRLRYEKFLPAEGQVTLEIAAQKAGTVIQYSCSMGMYTGRLVFDLQ